MIGKFFLVALLATLALFSQEIFLKLIDISGKKIVQARLGSQLNYDSICWKEGALYIERGTLAGKIEGAFDKAVWKPRFLWKKRELGGTITVTSLELTQKELKAFSNSAKKKHFRPLVFNFDIDVPGAHLRLADVDLMLDILRQKQQLTLNSDLSGQNISDLYQMVCQIWEIPEPFSDWEVIGGDLRGEVQVSFAKGQLYSLEGKIDATQIEAENALLALCGQWEKLHVDFALDMSSSLKVDTWDGAFSLIGGRLALLPHQEDFWDGMWDLSNLHSMISVKKGKVDSSFLRGSFFGMDGEIDLDWQSQETLMSLAFQCQSTEMLPILPERIRKGFEQSFVDDLLAVGATIKRVEEGLLLEGALRINDEHTLDFGCNFGQAKAKVASLPPMGTFADKLKEQFCLSSKRLGWIRGENFPLEKFFAPFFIPQDMAEFSGRINFEGTFDERYLVLFYEGEDFHLEGNSFDLKIARVNEEVTKRPAVHYVDLKTGDHEGVVPIAFAQYTHKKQGVVFEPISAIAQINNNQVDIRQIETNWSDVTLRGQARINLAAFDHISVEIELSDSQGSIEDALELCNYFHKVPFDSPVEGTFEANKQGLYLNYQNGKLEEVTFSAKCQGSSQLYGVAVEDASFQFDYDRARHLISFSNGALHAIYEQKEYPLQFDHLSFSPNNWQLITPQLHASLVAGRFVSEGLFQARGDWQKEHFSLDSFYFRGWRGRMEIVGTKLQEFFVKRGENELFLKGDLKEREIAIERVLFDLSSVMINRMQQWQPEGIFEGTGTISFQDEFTASINSSFKNLHFGGMRFGDGENLLCTISQSAGISIEGLEIEASNGSYKLGGFHYNPSEEKIHFDGFDFAIKAGRLSEVVTVATELFPGKIHATLREHLVGVKDDEEFAGRINIEVFPNNLWVALSLNDGTYTLFGQKVDLRSFTLSYDPLELNVKSEARYMDDYYWLNFITESSTLDDGQLSVYERDGNKKLNICWDRGWQVSKIKGEIAGLEADLAATSDQKCIGLEGSLAVNSQRIVPLISGKMRALLDKIAISGNYKLDGQWRFPKEDPLNPDFFGTLEGHNCNIFKVGCNTFAADLQYCNETLRMHELRIIDWSGTLILNELRLNRALDVSIGELSLENFRLSRLNSPWTDMEKRDRPLFRSFCVPKFTMIGLQGSLNEPDSLTGSGSFYFTNYAKKTIFSNLMQLPTEISARLGLDFTNMIPVRGQVIYTIDGGKINIKELRDVYSEGKRARFFLAEDQPAYLDFAGNLDVQIRMKQYTLLMKIADLFTLRVKGTVTNPLFTISNHD